MRKYNVSILAMILISLSITVVISLFFLKNKNSEETNRNPENNNSLNNEEKTEIKTIESRKYNNSTNLEFLETQDHNLSQIIEKIKNKAEERQLPLDKLYISLIDLNKNTYVSYQDEQPRYPASMVKLFWLILFYEKYNSASFSYNEIAQKMGEENLLKMLKITDEKKEFNQSEDIENKILAKMIQDSDNEAASFIVDKITDTVSYKTSLSSENFIKWRDKRYSANQFFIEKGYPQEIESFNISQKTFPIPYLKVEGPEGSDLQIRQINGVNSPPIRNKLTSKSMSRLMYEIYKGQIISPQYSGKILQFLKRDIDSLSWKNEPYDAIEYFLAEGIPEKNVQFFSKMGWTFNNRNDAAIIISPDQKTKYILVIFGDDAKFYEDQEFLPIISKMVYEEMKTNINQ